MTITPELIATTLASIPTRSDDELIYIWKICTSLKSNSDRKLVAPLLSAVERQRKILRKTSTEDTSEET